MAKIKVPIVLKVQGGAGREPIFLAKTIELPGIPDIGHSLSMESFGHVATKGVKIPVRVQDVEWDLDNGSVSVLAEYLLGRFGDQVGSLVQSLEADGFVRQD